MFLQTFHPIDPYLLYRVQAKGADSSCGCPRCCPGSSIEVNLSTEFLPNELHGFYHHSDFKAFVSAINHVLDETHWPVFPCMFTHFCIPFSPVCAMGYCSSQRKKGVEKLVKEENDRIQQFGLYWQLGNAFCHGGDRELNPWLVELIVSGASRSQFEAMNPAQRKFIPGSYGTPAACWNGPSMQFPPPQQQSMLQYGWSASTECVGREGESTVTYAPLHQTAKPCGEPLQPPQYSESTVVASAASAPPLDICKRCGRTRPSANEQVCAKCGNRHG